MKRIRLLVFFLISFAFALCGCNSNKTVELNKYIDISTKGYDSLGEAKCSFDKQAFLNDLEGIKLKANASELEGALMSLSGSSPEQILLSSCINYKLDKTSNLENGDTVCLKWSCNDDRAEKYFGVKLVYSDIEYEVNDLKELDKFDPFDYITVSFSGYSSDGTLEYDIDLPSEEKNYIWIQPDKKYGLSNGDEVTFNVTVSSKQLASELGEKVVKTEKTYTVEGLAEYEVIDAFEYLDVSFEGYNGYGQVTLNNNLPETEKRYVSFRTDNVYLKNGDALKIYTNVSSQLASECGKVVKETEKTFVVSGLAEIEEFDPFSCITVTFSGVTPNGTCSLSIDKNVPETEAITYGWSKTTGLKIGDTVTVTARSSVSLSGKDLLLANYGKKLSATEKIYTVDGLWYYVEAIDDIPQEDFDTMSAQLKDYFYAHAANSWSGGVDAIKEFKLLGNYLVYAKEGMLAYNDYHNYLYYLYEVKIENEAYGEFSYIWYGNFKNILVNNDGNCSYDLTNYYASESSYSWGTASGDYLPVNDTKYYVAGFADLDGFFNNRIMTKIEKYMYVSNMD